MPKKKTPELTREEQFRRLREAAKVAEVSDKEEDFERALKQVARPVRRTSKASD